MLLISGPAGVGKTTFVNHLLQQQTEATVVKTRIIDSVAHPYGPYTSAVRTLFQLYPDLRDTLSLAQYLYPLLPELHQRPPDASRQTLIDAIREVFWEAAGNRFLIFVIEDLHRADAATLELIPQHLEGLSSCPFLLIGTYRSEGLSHDHKLRWLRTELRRGNRLQEIALNALKEEELAELLYEVLKARPGKDLLKTIYHKTAGNPLFSLELVRALQEQNLLDTIESTVTLAGDDLPIPDSIRDLVALQTETLTNDQQSALEIAASLGEEFRLEVLNQLIDGPDIIDDLLHTGMKHESQPGIGVFRHSLFREAVYQSILWSRRKQINQCIAELLKQQNAEPEMVGDFFLKAGNKTEAIAAFSSATKKYCSIFAYKDATISAHKALDNWPPGSFEPERLSLLDQLAQCARLSGQIHDSILALRELAESAAIKDHPDKMAAVQRDLATCYALQGSWSSYKTARKQAAIEFEKADHMRKAAKEWCALANQYLDELNIAATIDAVDRALDILAGNEHVDIRSRALSLKGYALAVQGKTTEGQSLAREAISIALTENNTESAAYAYRKLAGTYEFASDFDQSLQVYDTALNFCYKENLNVQAQFCLSCMSWVLFRLGDWKRALEVSYEVINDAQTNNASKATANIVIGIIRSYRGELKQAKTHLDQGLILSRRENFKLITLISDWAFAVYFEMSGDEREADQRYRDLITHWEEFHDLHDVLPGLVAASAFYARRNEPVSLTRCIKILSELCDATGNPEAVGSLTYTLALRAHLHGEHEDAVHQFRQAIFRFRDINIPLQLIAARRSLGATLQALRQSHKAVEELQTALKDAKNLGLRPWAGEIRQSLEELGATETESRNRSHPSRIRHAGLTRRQVEVIEEMARGLSNKEIASNLHLSTRTVDMHVSNILSRLNCRTRTEAVKIALEEELIE
jgi:DNA-binding CsgD family transcriptional regulator